MELRKYDICQLNTIAHLNTQAGVFKQHTHLCTYVVACIYLFVYVFLCSEIRQQHSLFNCIMNFYVLDFRYGISTTILPTTTVIVLQI